MKLALNLLAVSPLIVVGIVALVVVVVAAVALVLVHVRKTGKKNKNEVAQKLHTSEPANQPEQPAPELSAEDEELGRDLVSAEDALNELENRLNELEQQMSEISEEEAEEEPVAEEAVEEVAEEPVAEEAVEEVVEEPAVEIPPEEPEAQAVAKEQTPAPAAEVKQSSEKIKIRVSYNRSLTAKLIQADGALKDYYSDIKNELLSYKKVKSRMSWRYETFRRGRKLLAKFTVRGKTLNVYLALNPENYAGTKYKIIDVSHVACNSSVPSLYKIKNERRRRYVKQLIADLMSENGVEPGKKSEVDYASQYPYEEIEQLIERNLVKLVPWKEFGAGAEVGVISVKEEDITQEIEQAMVTEEQPEVTAVSEEVTEESEVYEEEPVEETALADEEEVTEEPAPEPAEPAPEGFVRIRVRYNRSFTAKLIQADDTVKNYYEQIKNELLKYKKVKSRISWRQESFRRGRKLLARMQIRGKTLSVYFALNPADYEGTKYKVLDVSQIARNAEVPALYKIKNDRRCRYAKQLIADLMTANGVIAGEEQNENYSSQYPYEEIEPLIERNLVKLVPWKEFVSGSEVGVITVKEEDVTEEIAMAAEQPVEDDYVEEAVSNFFDELEEEQEKQEEPVAAEPEITIDVAEADEILGDEYVEAFVRQSERYSDRTKKAVVNIDTLGRYFNAGERVTVEEIKKRVPGVGGKVTYVKVLARGKLDKALTVEADDFSPQAIKMIVLTGGSVERKARK